MQRTNESWFKVVWRMMLPLLMYEAIGLVIQIVYAAVVSAKAMIGTDLAALLADETQYLLFMNTILEAFYAKMYYSLVVTAAVSVPLLCLMMRKDQRRRQAAGWQVTQIQVPAMVYPLVALVAFACCIGGNNLILSSGLMEVDETYQQLTDLLYSAPLWLQLIGTGVIVPLCEELIFRGVMYNRAKEYIPVRWALFLSALAFGIGHGNMVQAVYAFALGYLMCYLYENTGKLWVPVLFHIVANMVSVLITETTLFQVLYLNEITVLLSGAAGVLLAIAGMQAISRVMVQPVEEESYDNQW